MGGPPYKSHTKSYKDMTLVLRIVSVSQKKAANAHFTHAFLPLLR